MGNTSDAAGTNTRGSAGGGAARLPRNVSADDLLVMLTVARLGKFTAAAEALGLNHTTVSRRIAALEKGLGERVLVQGGQGWELTERGHTTLKAAEEIEHALASLSDAGAGLGGMVRVACPEGFAVRVGAPAAVTMQREHPGVSVEIISATQRVRHDRSGLDIEIVVERPTAPRAQVIPLREYALGLFASRVYLDAHGPVSTLADLAHHPLIYYVESALHVGELDEATASFPKTTRHISSTSVLAHLVATEAGGGVGLLPTWLGRTSQDLVRVVPDFAHPMQYWAVIRQESARSPLVATFLETVRRHLEVLG